ncbi:MAG TPA: DUF1707 domain-containing protein [Trebonia sp.]|jgi:hypothetical protein|nr:DUF1707 domain-containing protein [Trebonia sp.]
MASDHTIRASDHDRDVVVDGLREAYVAGRLTLQEFNERTAAAYAGRTWGELRKLTEDLPSQPVLGTDVPAMRPPGDGERVPGQPPALSQRPGPRPAQRGRPGAVVPFVVFWVVIVLASRSSFTVVGPVIIFVLAVLMTSIARRR